MIPNELSDFLENVDPEDLQIVITKADYKNSNPSFDIEVTSVTYDNEKNVVQNWTIETKQYRNCVISLSFCTTLQIVTNHPILWQYSDTQSSMYFSGKCSDANSLFVELYSIHESIFEGVVPFSEILYRTTDFSSAMESTSGLFAQGPRKLLEKFGQTLEKYNLKYTIIGDRIPSFWNGQEHLPETGDAKVLFINNSYVIASGFKFLAR
jgi:hypothetical protein